MQVTYLFLDADPSEPGERFRPALETVDGDSDDPRVRRAFPYDHAVSMGSMSSQMEQEQTSPGEL